MAAMAELGLKVKFGVYSWNVYGYLAGTDEQRASVWKNENIVDDTILI